MPNARLLPTLIAALLTPAAPSLAAPAGALDTGWSGDGIAVAAFSGAGSSSSAQQIAVQPDGRVLVAGLETGGVFQATRWVVARFDASGALDPSFGADGRVTVDLGDERGDRVGLALLSSGGFLVAGAVDTPSATTTDVAVAAFRADGSPDEEYSAAGVRAVSAQIGAEESFGGLAVDGQQRAYVVGTTSTGSDSDVFVARLTPGGDIDTSFGGGDGVRIDAIEPALDERVADAALVGDRLHVLGDVATGDSSMFVARYITGDTVTPDNGFDGDGVATVAVGGQDVAGQDLTVLPDGRVRVAASAGSSALVAALTAAGAPDTAALPPDGRRLGVPPGTESTATGVLVDTGGHLVVTGNAGSPPAGYVRRLLPAGSPDTAFSDDGWAQPAGTPASAFARLALAPDGDYLVAGSSGASATATDAAVFKVNAVPEPDPTPVPTPTATPTPTPTPTPDPVRIRAADVIRLPSARRCLPKRTLRFRLKPPAGGRIASATVKATGRRTQRLAGARLTGARVTLRRLPRRARVVVRVRLASGQTLSLSRIYRGCRR